MNASNDQSKPHPNRAGPVVGFDNWCVRCGYNLRFIPHTANCPACGTPVSDTLSSNLIADAQSDYVAALRKGVSLILNSILLSIGVAVVMVAIMMVIMAANGIPTPPPSASPFQPAPLPLWWSLSFGFLSLACQIAQMYGLWLFTTHDPAFSGRHNAAGSRTWIRHLIVITLTLTIVSLIVQQFTTHVGVTIAFAVLGLAVWIPLACLQMSYVCWLAPRLPDARVAERAKLLTWLYPLLSTVGILVIIGPLVGLILYWNLLNWIRRDLKYLLELQAYEDANTPAQQQR